MSVPKLKLAPSREDRIAARLVERGLFGRVGFLAAERHVLVKEILSKSRRAPIVRARHALWRHLHDDAKLSWTMIADIFETKHDSIIHASGHAEKRSRSTLEARVAKEIAAYVRRQAALSHNPHAIAAIADEIEAGTWRA